MAGGKAREIKVRTRSIRNTEKITRAMGLVASSKLGRAKDKVERSRPYFQILHNTLIDLAGSAKNFVSPYIASREVKSSCYIVIGGDKGFAGGYNNNVLKKAEAEMWKKNVSVFPIGKKCLEYYKRQKAPILSDMYGIAADCNVGICFEISKYICEAFLDGEFDEVIMVYTNFVSMLVQTPVAINLLPLSHYKVQVKGPSSKILLYEPSSEEVYNAIVPEYVAGLLYGALCESQASELGARHTAMDAASRNAEEMLELLDLQYNRVRQGDITQQITEIISGSGE